MHNKYIFVNKIKLYRQYRSLFFFLKSNPGGKATSCSFIQREENKQTKQRKTINPPGRVVTLLLCSSWQVGGHWCLPTNGQNGRIINYCFPTLVVYGFMGLRAAGRPSASLSEGSSRSQQDRRFSRVKLVNTHQSSLTRQADLSLNCWSLV